MNPSAKYRCACCTIILFAFVLARLPVEAQNPEAVARHSMTTWGEGLINDPETIPHAEYPRPDLVRQSSGQWQNLNGYWNFLVRVVKNEKRSTKDPETAPALRWQGKIRVPFAIESNLSGVGRLLGRYQQLWYRRVFKLDYHDPSSGHLNKRHFINFEAVDFRATVWLNNVFIGEHFGGFAPFRLEVTGLMQSSENELIVRSSDGTGRAQLRGKQSRKPGGIYYTRVSGIWGTVWLETVPAHHFQSVKVIPGSGLSNPLDLDPRRGTFKIQATLEPSLASSEDLRHALRAEFEVRAGAESGGHSGGNLLDLLKATTSVGKTSCHFTHGKNLTTRRLNGLYGEGAGEHKAPHQLTVQAYGKSYTNYRQHSPLPAVTCEATLTLEAPGRWWSPKDPFLYDVVAHLVRDPATGEVLDEVVTYAALRSVGTVRSARHGQLQLTLNGEAFFQLGALDQGWWPDGLLTPPSDEAQLFDIQYLKAAGFNVIRKHAKVESRRWYYHCDRLGMLVWQDQVPCVPDAEAVPRLQPEWVHLDWPGDDPPEATTGWYAFEHAQFIGEFEAMVDTLEAHPSIVTWVPFNEAWGQHRTSEVTTWLQTRDPTRLTNCCSGGNFVPVGDMVDAHSYPEPSFPMEPGNLERWGAFVMVVGEFGGHGLAVPGHTWRKESGSGEAESWGYGGGLLANFTNLRERYRNSLGVLGELADRGVAAGIYTQTTDVEREVNGLITYDRRVQKIHSRELNEWHRDWFARHGGKIGNES